MLSPLFTQMAESFFFFFLETALEQLPVTSKANTGQTFSCKTHLILPPLFPPCRECFSRTPLNPMIAIRMLHSFGIPPSDRCQILVAGACLDCLCIPSSWRGASPITRAVYQRWSLTFTESLPRPDIVLQDLCPHLPSQNLRGTYYYTLSLINVWWTDIETTFPFPGVYPCPLEKKKEFVSNLFCHEKALAGIFLHCKAYVTT